MGRPGLGARSYFDHTFLEFRRVPGLVLDAENVAVNNIDKTPALLGLTV